MEQLIQTKAEFKHRGLLQQTRRASFRVNNKVTLSVILVKQGYTDKVQLFDLTYPFRVSFHLSFHSVFYTLKTIYTTALLAFNHHNL